MQINIWERLRSDYSNLWHYGTCVYIYRVDSVKILLAILILPLSAFLVTMTYVTLKNAGIHEQIPCNNKNNVNYMSESIGTSSVQILVNFCESRQTNRTNL